MTTAATISYATWHTDPQREASMGNSHAPLWRHFIETVPERDFTTRTVLDFGCNRGGFLRLLHTLRPFRFGVGIDIAKDSIAAAAAAKGDLPLQFEVATDLTRWKNTFDIAFSYEVIYLLPDLARHAHEVFAALRDGGVYYAVTGCHTESPLWPKWRALIGAASNAPVQNYAPQDFLEAFVSAGFDVSVKRFGFDGFIPASKDRSYYPSILDAIAYPSEHKLMFRLEKRV
jgi:SAM-dependent methyltransferase